VSEEPAEQELLGLLGFDRLEVWLESSSNGDEEYKQRLRDQVRERLTEEAEVAREQEDEDRMLQHYLDNPIDPVYLPFTGNQLLRHFAPAAGGQGQHPHRHLRYHVRSACSYQRFGQTPGSPERLGAPLQELKRPCQIEKDERFWLEPLHALEVAGKWATIRGYSMREITSDPERLERAKKFVNDGLADGLAVALELGEALQVVLDAHRLAQAKAPLQVDAHQLRQQGQAQGAGGRHQRGALDQGRWPPAQNNSPATHLIS
jgi:hypothetical protein